MLNIPHISLSNGQSYQDIVILEAEDITNLSLPMPLEEYYLYIKHNNDLLLIHMWNVKIIKLDDKHRKPSPGSCIADRLIIDGDIIFQNVTCVKNCEYKQKGIPIIFQPENGISQQFVYSCKEGTYITRPYNVTSLIYQEYSSRTIKTATCPMIQAHKTQKVAKTRIKRNRN